MKVRISELRQAANVLFDHLERTGHAEIDMDRDLYWYIPEEKVYSPHETPSDLTLGNLKDDLENVRGIVTGKDDPIAYGLVWLATILRFVGSRIVR